MSLIIMGVCVIGLGYMALLAALVFEAVPLIFGGVVIIYLGLFFTAVAFIMAVASWMSTHDLLIKTTLLN